MFIQMASIQDVPLDNVATFIESCESEKCKVVQYDNIFTVFSKEDIHKAFITALNVSVFVQEIITENADSPDGPPATVEINKSYHRYTKSQLS